MKRLKFCFFIILILLTIFTAEVEAKEGEPVTKEDFKLFVEMINKRFEDMQRYMDKRFEDMRRYMDKRFNIIIWILGLGFPAVIGFSLFLYRLTKAEMNRRFEEVNRRFEEVNRRFEEVNRRFEETDRRFEEVMSVLLIIVKAHEREIGSEVIDVTLGKKRMEDIAKEMKEDFEARIKEKEKEKIKEYIKDPEIINIIVSEIKKLNQTGLEKQV